MMWNGDGSGGWWLIGVPMMIICVVMMVAMMGHGFGHGSHRTLTGESSGHRSGDPERILADRFARGEIDTDEYERRLAALRPTSDPGRT